MPPTCSQAAAPHWHWCAPADRTCLPAPAWRRRWTGLGGGAHVATCPPSRRCCARLGCVNIAKHAAPRGLAFVTRHVGGRGAVQCRLSRRPTNCSWSHGPWLRRHGCSLRDAAKAIAGLLSHSAVASAQGFEAIADAGNLRSATLHARLGSRSRLENSSLGRHGAYMVSQCQSPPRRNADRRKPRRGHRVPAGPGVAIRRPFTTRALDAERQNAQV
jgi:hypothetical protein